jgi:hypothetical protein
LLDVDEFWLRLLDDQVQAEPYDEGMEIVHSTMQASIIGAKSEMKRKWKKFYCTSFIASATSRSITQSNTQSSASSSHRFSTYSPVVRWAQP